MDAPPAPSPQASGPPASLLDADMIAEETGEGLLDNPFIMSMYQAPQEEPPTSPSPPPPPPVAGDEDSSPESSPVRLQQVAEESLSDREFEQMEAVAAASTHREQVSDDKDSLLLDSRDPLRTPSKAATKSSDDEDYEVIPQNPDVSNLLSLSPVRCADRTVTEAPEAEEAARDEEREQGLQAKEAGAGGAAPEEDAQAAWQEEQATEQTVPSSGGGATGAAVETQVADPCTASAAAAAAVASSDSEPESDPVSPALVLLPASVATTAAAAAAPTGTSAAPKKTLSSEDPSVRPFPQTQSVVMASADSSTSCSGCPFTSGSYA